MAASSLSSLLLPSLPLGCKSKTFNAHLHQGNSGIRFQRSTSETGVSRQTENRRTSRLVNRRDAIGLICSVSGLLMGTLGTNGAGLPPEQKPRLCDDTCEKELENVCSSSYVLRLWYMCLESSSLFSHSPVPMVTTESGLQYKDIKVGKGPSPPIGFQVAANYVAMIPNGQIFDSSLEKGQPYIFRVGSGQVVKGLDEGILTMKTGGKRRLYIPGSLAFPKGLTSAPGRPRVAPNSPVVFDVSLEYIPGLELDEE
ncbi:peptidyl-prolyl cis-trans isomerase FKBP16-3, chloroplastic-like [Punica granatum]|uniref:peptidylprolyl isomerase n=1 Tax=Punica granatum TaxID=22663 RepID=A0A6P8BNS0_PUNGR|nr:peptidyl-prolyl cis-trans isomerase FKBP16-3, chloroplastic-like [Punica granatum]